MVKIKLGNMYIDEVYFVRDGSHSDRNIRLTFITTTEFEESELDYTIYVLSSMLDIDPTLFDVEKVKVEGE